MKYLVSAFLLLCVSTATPQEIAGKKLSIQLGDTQGRSVPVSVQISGETADADFAAIHGDTESSFPATLHDGELTVMLDGTLDAGTHVLRMAVFRRRYDPKVKVTKRTRADVLDVAVNGEPVTSYHFGDDLRKPYLWPLKAEGGVSVTRDYPMGDPDRSRDHPHHTSFWTGYGDLNGADYWEHGERTGWQHTESIEYGSGDAYGWIETRIVWQDKDRKPVIDERRTYRFYNTPETERLFDVTVALTASHGDVKFGDTKEGGMVSLRMADALRERGGSGRITNSVGGVGAAETWGKPAAWCDYSGSIEGFGPRGITIMDHPSSFRHPTHWHVRDYGLMGANAFGYSHFYDGEKNGDHLLKSGETMTFRYRIFVHSGDVEDADVAGHYADFSDPPTAAWLEE